MERLDPKTDGASKNIVEENIEKLKAIFPSVFTEAKIDFDALKETLGDYTDETPERYSFNWNGKARARHIAQTPSTGTLRPCPEESVKWDTTQNLFIEGDNLEVLKLLQKSYHKKVKIIYIDPPYNTGKEIIYPDKFQENLDTYLKYTGQIDDEGFKVSPNAETDGRYHTNWLNMMYPRLKLARNLLRDDGMIFISIDDNEASRIKLLCDEIFGEENFVVQMIWKNKTGGGAKTKGWIGLHEYILCYAKSFTSIEDISIPYSEKTASMYNKKDEHFETRGPYATWPLDTTSMGDRPNLRFPISHNGVEIMPEKQWLWSKERVAKAQAENGLVFNQQTDGSYKIRFKGYLRNEDGQMRRGKPLSLLEGPYTQEGSKDFQKLLPKAVFPFPKPVRLLIDLFKITTSDQEEEKDDDIILDFFSGSSTTAHAIFEFNKENGSNYTFILVQLPEFCGQESEAFKAGYKTIADIGKERIRKSAAKIKEENPNYEGDLGFKVFKLDASNVIPWDADFDTLESSLFNAVENIKPERSEADVLYEILLKYGLDLTLPIEERKFEGKTVFVIGAGALIVCLDSDITLKTVEGIAALKTELKPEVMRVVFKDAGFKDDVVKTNAVQILKQANIDDVKSL